MALAREDVEALLCMWGMEGALCGRLRGLERELAELEARLSRTS